MGKSSRSSVVLDIPGRTHRSPALLRRGGRQLVATECLPHVDELRSRSRSCPRCATKEEDGAACDPTDLLLLSFRIDPRDRRWTRTGDPPLGPRQLSTTVRPGDGKRSDWEDECEYGLKTIAWTTFPEGISSRSVAAPSPSDSGRSNRRTLL